MQNYHKLLLNILKMIYYLTMIFILLDKDQMINSFNKNLNIIKINLNIQKFSE